MSKGARKRETREEELRKQKIAEEQKSIQKKIKTKITVIVVICLAIVAVASVCASVFYGMYLDSGEGLRNTTVYSSENYTVDNAMMSYYIYDTYYSVVDYYGSQLASWGLDTSSSLKKQEYSEGISWFDYFADTAAASARQMVVLAEEAHKNGMTLSEKEISAIETKISSVDPKNYGRGLNKDDVLRAEKLSYLASKYDDVLMSSIDTSDSAINTYYNENKKDILKAVYRMYSFYFDDNTENDTPSEQEAKKLADELANCKTEEEYTAWLKNYFENIKVGFDPNAVEAEIAYSLVSDGTYSDEYESLKWIYDEKREVGDTYIERDSDYQCYSVYMVITPYKRDTSSTVNVRHVLLSSDKYGSIENAKNEAEKLHSEWLNSGATEEDFKLLALGYSTDPGSMNSGGLYENIREGEMVDSFNDWCFNENRKSGDSGVVLTSYGAHIMYFCGEGLEAYKADIKSSIINESYTEAYSAISGNATITDNAKNVYSIPEKTM